MIYLQINLDYMLLLVLQNKVILIYVGTYQRVLYLADVNIFPLNFA